MSTEKLDQVFKKLSKEITGSDNLSFLNNLRNVLNSIQQKLNYSVSDYSSVTSTVLNSLDKRTSIEHELSDIQPERSRLFRYREYEYISNRITYIHRALNILTQNIISPDDITKLMFDITGDDVRLGSKIVQDLDLDLHTLNIIYKTLQLGDFFVEIVTEETYKNYMKAMLTETELKKKLNIEITSTTPSKVKSSSRAVKLKFHHPSNVVVLGFDDVVLGYLVFPNIQNSRLFPGTGLGISIYQIPALGVNNAMNIDTATDISQTKRRISDFSKKILSNLLKDKYDEKRYQLTRNEITELMLTLLMNIEDTTNVEVRYVPPDRMVHFKLVPSDFSPYGQSKLKGIEVAARNLIAIENSIVYYRLTRSVDRRVFHVEVGRTKDVQDKLQSFIRSLKRQRINVEGMAIDEIASKIGQFEDIFAPMRDGKRFVEVDTMTSQNLNISVSDWVEMRDMLVSGLEIPPAYLGIEQNYETRGTLSQENVVFAVSVLYYQRVFSRYFTELIHKVSKQKLGRVINVDVTFRPPYKLLLERYSEMMQSFSSMKDILDQVGVSSKAVFEKFFGTFLSETEKTKSMIDKMKDTILKPGDQSDSSSGGGGFGF